jgi:twitching motility protein PilT
MYVTHAVANLIRENKVYRIPSSIQTGKRFGMQLRDEHLFKLFAEQKISADDAIDFSQSPSSLQEKIEAFKKGQIAAPEEAISPEEQPEPAYRR